MRTAALLLPLALAATFTSAPLLAAPATAAPTIATKSRLHLQTFHPGPQAMFSVSSVLIEGRHDAIPSMHSLVPATRASWSNGSAPVASS